MKKTLFLLFFIPTIFSFSQSEISRKLGDFHKIQTYDLLKVNLIKSDKNAVVISGQHPNYVVVKNKNGELKIRMGIEKRLSGGETKVDLYYKNIYRIEAKEGSFIFSKTPIIEPSLFIKSESGALVSLALETPDLSSKTLTGGKITISGVAAYNEITAYTGGYVNAKKLKTETSKVFIKAGGVVDVYATSLLELDLKAGGEANVHYKTKKIIEKITLGGVVNYLYN
ncbi:DUF2807 domain-containing protein [Flavobacteriaceae bacterium]|nr:DUF2807 domain-containing protein [Flavobacteriaceae bacterium]MDC1535059.1 DUF2807 domain-containing protein [Flavobacteriaceae bacterium]